MKRTVQHFLIPAILFCVITNHAYGQQNTEQLIANDTATVLTHIENDPAFWPNFSISSHPYILASCNNDTYTPDALYAFYFTPTSNVWQSTTLNGHAVSYDPTDSYQVNSWNLYSGYDSIDNQPSFIAAPIVSGAASCVTLYQSTAELEDIAKSKSTRRMNDLELNLTYRLMNYALYDAPDAKQQQARMQAIRNYQPKINVDDATFLRLEEMQAQQYIAKNNDETLKNIIALEVTRRATMSSKEIAFNKGIMNFASLLEYTSHQMNKYLDRSDTLFTLTFPLFDSAWDIEAKKSCITDGPEDMLNDMRMEVSAALTYSAEQYAPNWKAQFNLTQYGVVDSLKNQFNLSNEEIARRITLLKTSYDYDTLKIEVTSALNKPYCDNNAVAQPKDKTKRFF